MGVIGFLISLLAGLFMLIGIIPFLGWLNWFTTVPLGVLAVIISAIAVNRRSALGTAGLVIGIIVLVVAFLRLWLGGGFL